MRSIQSLRVFRYDTICSSNNNNNIQYNIRRKYSHAISTSSIPQQRNRTLKISNPTYYRPYSTTPKHSRDAPIQPLRGIRILDFTRILAGPFCTQILADYGADVIKLEAPGRGDETRSWRKAGEDSHWKADSGPISFFFAALNGSKRSLTLDLKSDAGRDAVLRIVEKCGIDVVVENFVPGTMERLGIGYEVLAERNPRLVFASISGYGPSGPNASRAGYDAIANAESGMMSITGENGGPPVRTGVGLTDMATGLYVHGAIASALYQRERTGKGMRISASLFETSLSMLTSAGAHWLNLGIEERRWGAGHPNAVPYNAWECADGVYIVVAGNSDRQYGVICDRLGKPEWKEDERFVTNAKRVENREVLDNSIGDVFRTRPHDEWMKILDGSGLAHGPVNTTGKAFQLPQTAAREMVQEIEWDALEGGQAWKAIGPAVQLGESKDAVRRPPSRLGEHSEQVLSEAGYGKEEIVRMKRDGVL